MTFIVTRVVDGDTFDVYPAWITPWGAQGHRVRIADYNASEIYTDAGVLDANALNALIQGRQIELQQSQLTLSYRRLVANVFLNGIDVASILRAGRLLRPQ